MDHIKWFGGHVAFNWISVSNAHTELGSIFMEQKISDVVCSVEGFCMEKIVDEIYPDML